MLDTIKPFYRGDVFFSIPFETLWKESRVQEEIVKFLANVLDVTILYYNSKICALDVGDHKKIIVHDSHDILYLKSSNVLEYIWSNE